MNPDPLSAWLYKISKGWVALIGLFLFLSFSILVLPAQSSNLEYGEDIGSPDMAFSYSADDLYRWAEAFGETGRMAYVQVRFQFDLVWPLVYTIFLSTSISWLLGFGLSEGNRWRILNILPVLGMIFDYLENISTSAVMYRYPNPTAILAHLAPFFTMIKWILIAGSFLILFFAFCAAVYKLVRRR